MSAAAFDASAYRRSVLTPLRSANPATVQDVFWLGDVPRELDDAAEITARLAATKAFLHKERSRPRQADVAAAVLREWPRIEGVLGDPAARSALRQRLGRLAPGAEVSAASGTPAAAPAGGGPSPVTSGAPGTTGASGAASSGALRLRQVRTALDELARIRDEPELAEDLFAFLGLPVSATPEMVRARVELVGDANRKRRADRERSLVDELLMHCRELLVDGDPAAYRAALAGEVTAPEESRPPEPQLPPEPGRIDYTRRPKRATTPEPQSAPEPQPAASAAPAAVADADAPTAVTALSAERDPSGAVVLTWDWPSGVTEAFVTVGAGATPVTASAPSRKVTNTKYEIDGGARFDGVEPGATLTVFSGRRDATGVLVWSPAGSAPATIAP